uniref:Coagulation factor IX n=1 Tax=Cyclopterus lumpus TaxID=8103 RepID=A0A8C2WV37_CYCLU
TNVNKHTLCRHTNTHSVFVSQQTADTVLRRLRRYNSGHLEEMVQKDNLERECKEETCTLEEAREVFEDNGKAMAFWAVNIDGDQCKPPPCQNGGVCEDGISAYVCYCKPNFSGKNCEIEVSKQCSVNNGGCSHFCVMKAMIPVCRCAAGYRLGPDKRSCEPTESMCCDGALPYRAYECICVCVQVALMKNPIVPQRAEAFCGGSLLSELWVATAAHCLEQVGEYDVNQDEGPERDHEVAELLRHPMYNTKKSQYNHDIALLKLASPVELSNQRRPICLGPKDFTETILRDSSSSLVSGWGKLNFDGRVSPKLKKLEVPYVDRTACKQSSQEQITRYMFCSGFRNERKDACQGDSGGPHATYYKGTWFLTGIISWGEECALDGKYGVYTRVSRYHKWIMNFTVTITYGS